MFANVVRPGPSLSLFFFVQRVLNQLGTSSPPPQLRDTATSGSSARVISLGPEFHADLAFWRLVVAGERLEMPLYPQFLQPPSRML